MAVHCVAKLGAVSKNCVQLNNVCLTLQQASEHEQYLYSHKGLATSPCADSDSERVEQPAEQALLKYASRCPCAPENFSD